MAYNCRKCNILLVAGENISQRQIDHSQYICRTCLKDRQRDQKQGYWQKNHEHLLNYQRDYAHRTGRHQPMNKNRECSAFLGVHVAEQVLSQFFKNVIRMPYGNPGYDFRCQCGYLIDVKASCRSHPEKYADYWQFHIRKNSVPDYFLCLAFDNRGDLNPEHIWLIPAGTINDRQLVSISEARLDKWAQYEKPIDVVMTCCNTMKNNP